jgi:AI-2 transport protein TqsA
MTLKPLLNPTLKTAAVLITIGAIVTILLFFKSFLQPLVFALLFWFIIIEVRGGLSKIKVFKKSLPKIILTIISTLIVFLGFYISINIIITNINKLTANFELYSSNLVALLEKIEELIGVENLGENLENQKGALMKSAANAATSLASFIGKLLLVFFYVLFLLLEESQINKKLNKIYGSEKDSNRIHKTWTRIHDLLSDYLTIKLLTSFLTGLLSFFVLLSLGIELPALWAFIIFILNFIPSVGSIIATSFPVIFSIIQYADIKQTLSVLVGVMVVQILIGNVVEPKLLGNKLNLSPLVVIIGLVFWGALWGVMGMLLSVPIMASLMIIFSQFPNTKNIAIFLSQNGEIDVITNES